MQLAVEQHGDVSIVRLRDPKLTYAGLASFFGSVRTLVEDGATKLLLDFGSVTYIDSASIGCLLDIQRLLKEKAGAMKLSALQPRVETMLSMTGVHKIIAIHREESEALAAFEAGA